MNPPMPESEARGGRGIPARTGALRCAALLPCALLTACALLAACARPAAPAADREVYRRAEAERLEYLEREVERLREDLAQAEDAMIWIESGLRGVHGRADAVSALAEARIAVEGACQRAPWRAADCRQAEAKLEEADRQMRDERFGAAVFFASRARRIAQTVREEAEAVARADSALFVEGRRVNLRAGPSTRDRVLAVLPEQTPVFAERHDGSWVLVRTRAGKVGWIHGALLRSP